MPVEYFKAVIDCVGDPIFIQDRQHRFVFVNNAACELFGKSREVILKKTDYELFTSEQVDISHIYNNYVFETGEEHINEELITDEKGNIRTIVTKKTLYVNEAGEKFVVASIRDITERKRMEEELLESEAKYRTVVESSLVGVYIMQDGLFRFVNRRWCEIYGYAYDEIVDKLSPLDLTPPEHKKLVEENIRKRLSGEVDRIEYETRAVRKDGKVISLKVLGSCMLYKGRPAISGTTYDITEHERAEEALRTSQIQLSEATDLARIVYWEFDPEDNMHIFNDPFYALYGTTAGQEGGYRMTSRDYAKRFVHPDDHPLFYETVKQNKIKPGPESVAYLEHRIIRRDGKVRHILARVGVVKDTSGRVVKIYGANQDITEYKQMEKAMHESEEKFRLLFEKSVDPILLLHEGRYIDCNEAAVKLAQCSGREDVIGLTPLDLSPERQPDGRLSCKKVQEIYETTFRQGVNHFEWMYYTATGEEFWVDITHTVIPIQGKQIIYTVWRDIRERKRAEMELMASEKKLRTVFDQTFQLMGLLTPDGIVLAVGKAALDFIGLNEPDVTGIPFPETPWWSHSREEQDKLKEAIISSKKGETVRFETTHSHKDGTLHHIDFSLKPVMDEYDNIVYLSAEGHDITNIKEKEYALKQAEAKYRTIFENARMGIYQTTTQGRIVVANPALACILGYDSPLELMNSFTDIGKQMYVNFQDRVKFKEDCLEHGFVESMEVQFYKKDRSKVWVSINGRAIKDIEDNILCFEGTVENITEHKHAEEELRQSRQQFFDIIEFLPDATIVIDAEKKVVAWNLACEEITGVRKEEMIGKGDYAYAIPFYGEKRPMLIDYVTMDSDELQQKYRSIIKKGNLLYAEAFTPMLYKGKGAFLSGKASPLFDKTGRISGAIENVRDITEFRYLETQLNQARKMEAIGTLTGGIAHDFNNILTALVGYASLLKMKINDATSQRYLDQIFSASEKAANLIQNLLTFSRKQPVSLKLISLHDTIKVTGKLLKRLVTEDIAIKTSLAAGDIKIMADATQIDQILFNLVTNARDAMPRGGTIIITTEEVELNEEFQSFHGYGKPGRYALISISDTGFGMDKKTQERIFDPFFTTKEMGKGTGMGLSTVYGIVKQHNGYIDVYSEPATGTIFRIYLPVVNRADNEERQAPAPARGGNETILVAEDDKSVRILISELLVKHGYKVIAAVDGADAIEQFKKTDRIDLLIMDSVMPKKNGREAYNEIKKIKTDIKVIFTSGYTRDVFLDKGIEDGKFNFLQKPVLSNTLLQKVREVLDDMQDSQ